jgi:Uma2 family endonuclease
MPLAQKYIPHYTYSDWLHWEGRWELIEGVPIAMSPMPLPEHQQVAGSVFYELKKALKASCKHCKAFLPLDYRISNDTILQPDVLIVCGHIQKSYLNFPPMLVVEVLSKATEDRDRGIKYDFYEQEGVKYYLIVDVKKKLIQIYQLINDKYELQTYANDFCFNLSDDCSIDPRLDNIWE